MNSALHPYCTWTSTTSLPSKHIVAAPPEGLCCHDFSAPSLSFSHLSLTPFVSPCFISIFLSPSPFVTLTCVSVSTTNYFLSSPPEGSIQAIVSRSERFGWKENRLSSTKLSIFGKDEIWYYSPEKQHKHTSSWQRYRRGRLKRAPAAMNS